VGENIDTIHKNTEALLHVSMEVGQEVNLEKTKYMLISRYQKARQKHSIKIAKRSSEVVAKFTHLGTTLTDQSCMHEQIKSRLNSENACYHAVQSLLSSRLVFRNVKVKICKTIILPVVLYGCKTWSLTLTQRFPNCGAPPGGRYSSIWGAICSLYEVYINFQLNMDAKIKYVF
jgi:hypothetical protein